MNRLLVILIGLASVATLTSGQSQSAVLSPKTCGKFETYNVTTVVSEEKPVQVRKYKFCVAIPPQCSTYTTEIKVVHRNEVIEKTRYINTCCEGYAESADGNHCIPICNPPCGSNGKCAEPNKCECNGGFTGRDCSERVLGGVSDLSVAPAPSSETSGENQGGMIAGISFAVLIAILIIAAIIVYDRRRIAKLKSDLQVSYVTRNQHYGPGGGEESAIGDHFAENPAYAFNNTATGPGGRILVTSETKKDNFNFSQSESKHLKEFPAFTEFNYNNSNGSTYDFPRRFTDAEIERKNREADALNPDLENIYNEIEEDFEKDKNVYDEISQGSSRNSGQGASSSQRSSKSLSSSGSENPQDLLKLPEEQEYDHLDHSRSSSEVNPLYQRVSTIPKSEVKKGGKRRGAGDEEERTSLKSAEDGEDKEPEEEEAEETSKTEECQKVQPINNLDLEQSSNGEQGAVKPATINNIF